MQRISTALKRKQRNLARARCESDRRRQEDLEAVLKEERYALIEQEELLRMQQELRALKFNDILTLLPVMIY